MLKKLTYQESEDWIYNDMQEQIEYDMSDKALRLYARDYESDANAEGYTIADHVWDILVECRQTKRDSRASGGR